jgi:poly-gamma-glutamate synthesis protein (capsule biosynthesis protein)
MNEFSISKKKLWLLGLSIAIFSAAAILLFTINRESKKSISSETRSTNNLAKDISGDNTIASKKPVKLLFVGDMMFDRYIREAVKKYRKGDYNYVLEPVKEKLAEYDLVIGNLEGPITDNESVSIDSKMGESKNFVFTFDPAVAKALFDNNIKLVNLGNNHILNQGQKGVEQTKKYLNEAGVEYFSDQSPTLVNDKSRALIRIGFVSYNYSIPDSIDAAVEGTKSAKEQSDIVVICPHWGTEYKVGDPGASVRALAHRFIEAGADAVIGTHPHVVQMSEEYKGKKIYYSLGNFVFDQYFQKETMEGLGVEITIKPDRTMEFGEIKFEMTKRGQTIFKVEP